MVHGCHHHSPKLVEVPVPPSDSRGRCSLREGRPWRRLQKWQFEIVCRAFFFGHPFFLPSFYSGSDDYDREMISIYFVLVQYIFILFMIDHVNFKFWITHWTSVVSCCFTRSPSPGVSSPPSPTLPLMARTGDGKFISDYVVSKWLNMRNRGTMTSSNIE